MMKVHYWLEKRSTLYKKWHQKPYANLVHYVILAAAVIIDVSLGYNLLLIINTI